MNIVANTENITQTINIGIYRNIGKHSFLQKHIRINTQALCEFRGFIPFCDKLNYITLCSVKL